ncbi:MAG: hypothetical protein PV362_14805 [Providencia heimbachae]|nr:hypothetical protein [Providencia heimbachae]
MYSTGTVTTTANSTKLVGTGTKWLNNINRVSAEQVILIQNGTTVYINSIASIQSDTELTLAFAAPEAVKNGTYRILTTMVNSASDAMNKIVSMNAANVQFSDIVLRLGTEKGIIEIVWPDGTKTSMKTFAEMDKQLDGKFDKTGGVVNGTVTTKSLHLITDGQTKRVSFFPPQADSNEAYFQYNDGPSWSGRIKIPYRTTSNDLMLVGDFGVGATSINATPKETDFNVNKIRPLGFFYSNPDSVGQPLGQSGYGGGIFFGRDPAVSTKLLYSPDWSPRLFIRTPLGVTSMTTWYEFYSTANTTKDSNGNLKAASPIVKIFADDIDVNEESEGVTLKKLHTGIYQLCGVLGMHSDASWGGVNGGITIPSGINQLPLIYVDYDVLVSGERHPFNGEIIQQDEHGDIVIYTSYRKHLDLPQNVQYARLKTYPEFAREIDGKLVELEAGEPIDIPNGHWIDVRVNMPSNSLYNQKQAEAQRLAEIEAERLAQEEAERIAEETKGVEQYGLGENNALL